MATAAESRAPYFEYEEVFKSGYVVSCWSAGDGRFHDFTTRPALVPPSFSVHVDSATSSLRVTVHSNNLKASLFELGLLDGNNPVMGLAEVLRGYELLSNCLAWLKTLDSDSLFYTHLPEMRLFASDFLRDGEIFKLFGYEALYEADLLNANHWRDIQEATTLRQLDDIERAVGFDERSGNQHLLPEPKGPLDEEFIDELRLAVIKGDLSTIKRLLSRREGLVDAQTLNLSLQFDRLDIFWSFMSHGTCIKGIQGKPTPLCTAAKRGHMHAVHALLESGAPINNARKSTPLTAAAAGGHFSIVQCLTEHGADINGNKDKRPIVAAAAGGHLDIVKYLVNAGASLDASSRNGQALSAAIHGGHDQIATYLLRRGASPHVKHRKWWSFRTPLSQAVVRSNFRMVEALLVAGANPNVDLDLRESPLAIAIRNGDYEIALLLRSRGALAESADLTSAVKAGNMQLIDMAVEMALRIEGNLVSLAIRQRKFDIALKLVQNALDDWSFERHKAHVQVKNLIRHNSTIGLSPWDLQILRQLESKLAAYRNMRPIKSKLAINWTTLPISRSFTYSSGRYWGTSWFASPPPQLSTLYRLTNRKKESNFCQQILTLQLRHGFKKLCRRVLAKAGRNQTSHDFAIFASSYHNPGSKFGKGMRTIRQLIRQRVPESLDHVVCCVMLADAMRTAKMREDFEVIDDSVDQFIQDLPRWRFLLSSEDEKLLFDEIVLGVWGSKPEPAAFDGDDAMAANLEYLQNLLSNLTSETHSLLGETGNDPTSNGGHRLSFLRQAGVESDCIASDYGDVSHEATKIFGVFEDPGPPEAEMTEEQLWSSAASKEASESQQSALMVMAGAIFGIILAFLVVLRWNVVTIHEFSNHIYPHSSKAGQILARNCLLLIIYLDLRKAPLPKVGCSMNEVQQRVEVVLEALEQTELPLLQQQVDTFSFSAETDLYDSGGGQAEPSQSTSSDRSPYSGAPACDGSEISATSTNGRSPSDSARPVCPHLKCGKSFATVSGRNKHAKFDCHWGPRVQFPCRNSGCRKCFSQRAYRDIHEKSRCKGKSWTL